MKKVVISETQLKHIVIHEECEDMLLFALNESANLSVIKKKIRKALIMGVSVAVILAAIAKLAISSEEKNELKQMVQTEMATDSIQQDTIPQQDTIHEQKVQACKEYMEWAMKNQGYGWETTRLTPEAIVTACEQNDFSIPFTIAIANLESCFGQTPRSKKTNSVFSVGSFDNGKNYCTYDSPDSSIIPFINTIKSDYLLNGKKSINDLLVPNGFVNINGDRYASNAKYEREVKNIMNRIIKKYPILGQ